MPNRAGAWQCGIRPPVPQLCWLHTNRQSRVGMMFPPVASSRVGRLSVEPFETAGCCFGGGPQGDTASISRSCWPGNTNPCLGRRWCRCIHRPFPAVPTRPRSTQGTAASCFARISRGILRPIPSRGDSSTFTASIQGVSRVLQRAPH